MRDKAAIREVLHSNWYFKSIRCDPDSHLNEVETEEEDR